jgi:subtilisin family serine protease
LRGYTIAHLDPKIDVADAVKKIKSAKSVEFAAPVAARWMLGAGVASQFRPHGDAQWALDCIGFRDVAAPRRGRIRIAVLDTGIDEHHPDLQGVDIRYDQGSMKPDDLEGHGTHVAGIISAIAARKDGMLGIAQCDLDVWKVFSDRKENGQRYVDSEMYNRALGLALDGGCSVVNLSLGGTAFDEVEARLIARLIRRGVAVVAAMGNEYEEGNPTEYPAALPDVIAVGGIDQDHERASFSNTGRHICVVAPAVGIRSTIPGTRSTRARYSAWDGTSFAAPQVSGLIGYLLGRGRLLKNSTPAQIRSRIASRATPLPGMRGRRFTPAFGHGLIDLPSLAGRSVKRVRLRRRGP